jgi:lipase chaperone LimK
LEEKNIKMYSLKKIIVVAIIITGLITGLSIFSSRQDQSGDLSSDRVVSKSIRDNTLAPSSSPSSSFKENIIADRRAGNKEKSGGLSSSIMSLTTAEELGKISRYGNLPSCLKNTLIGGSLPVDDQGRLVISPQIRKVFEYFLSAIKEEPLDKIIGRIKEYIQLTLPDTAEGEALALFDSYLEYKKNLNKFDPYAYEDKTKSEMVKDLRQAILDRIDARGQYLSPEVANAFFAREEAYDLFTIRRLEIENDNSMNDKEKSEKILKLEEDLPQDIRERRQQFQEERSLNERILDLEKEGGRDEEIYVLRMDYYGEEAADRLATYDKNRSRFNTRANDYFAFKQKTMANTGLNDEAKKREIEVFEKNNFNERELNRVRIWERRNSQNKKTVQ